MAADDIWKLPEPKGVNLSEKERDALLKKVRKIFLRREKEEAEIRRKELEQLLFEFSRGRI